MPDGIKAVIFQTTDISEVSASVVSSAVAVDPAVTNADAITLIWVYFAMLWVIFGIHGYFTLGLYSYYMSQKTV